MLRRFRQEAGFLVTVGATRPLLHTSRIVPLDQGPIAIEGQDLSADEVKFPTRP